MAQDREETALQRYFWLIAAAVLVVAIAVVVLTIRWISDAEEAAESELDDNYVEQIEIRSTPAGGGRYEDLIVIDGMKRYDCSARDGRLSCSDDPQPTPQDPVG